MDNTTLQVSNRWTDSNLLDSLYTEITNSRTNEPLPEDDYLFEAAVKRAHGIPLARARNIWPLAQNYFDTEEKAKQWFVAFYATCYQQPERFAKYDTSKCSGCKWNTICKPTMRKLKCPIFLSTQTPIGDIDVGVRACKSNEFFYYRYACGFLASQEGLHAAMIEPTTWDSFLDLLMRFDGSTVVIYADSSLRSHPIEPFILYKVRPNRNETYPEYRARVEGYLNTFHKRAQQEYASTEDLFRHFIKSLKHDNVLHEQYSGDVLSMVADWWPGLNPETLVPDMTQSLRKVIVTNKDIYAIMKDERSNNEQA